MRALRRLLTARPSTCVLGAPTWSLGQLQRAGEEDVDLDALLRLGKMRCSEKERPLLQREINRMIGFMAQIREEPTEGITPLISCVHNHISLPMQTDTENDTSGKEFIAENAPELEFNYIVVPKSQSD